MPDNPEPSYDQLRAAIRSVQVAPKAPSTTAQIGVLLDDIEAAFQAGATYTEVIDALAAKGLALSYRAFESALYRARKKRKAGGRKEKSGSAAVAQANHRSSARRTQSKDQKDSPKQEKKAPKRNPLQRPPPEKKFEWDPLERPVIEFRDSPDKSNDE